VSENGAANQRHQPRKMAAGEGSERTTYPPRLASLLPVTRNPRLQGNPGTPRLHGKEVGAHQSAPASTAGRRTTPPKPMNRSAPPVTCGGAPGRGGAGRGGAGRGGARGAARRAALGFGRGRRSLQCTAKVGARPHGAPAWPWLGSALDATIVRGGVAVGPQGGLQAAACRPLSRRLPPSPWRAPPALPQGP
jgi:hypothetical protein